jgi:hypothetical protein
VGLAPVGEGGGVAGRGGARPGEQAWRSAVVRGGCWEGA